MPKFPFPWLALGIGLFLSLLLIAGGVRTPEHAPMLPLLTQLILAEFGFVLTLVGAVQGVRALRRDGFGLGMLIATAGCGLLAAGLAVLGMSLWPGLGGA